MFRLRDRLFGHSQWGQAPTLITLGVLLLCVTIQVLTGTDARIPATLAFAAALAVWIVLVMASAKGRLGAKGPVAAMCVATAVMLAVPPATSLDFNSYSLYGRMVAEYGASPYVHTPRDFAADAWYPRISYFWTDAPSVYGPVFTAISAVIMSIAETSVLVARLGFGAVAGISFLAAVALAATRLGWARAAVLVGLNPLILTFGVNDVHADVLVGALVLAGALSLSQKRVVLGAVAFAAAALVKISVLPAFAGAAVWLWFKVSRRAAVVFSFASAVAMAVPIVVAGGVDVLEPLVGASGRHTRFSVWNPIYGLWNSGFVGVLANLSVAIVGLWLIWRHRRDATPFVVVAAGLVAYQLLGAYVLSWYAVWSLPVLALAWDTRIAKVAMLHGSWVAVAYFNGWIALVIAATFLFLSFLRRQESRKVRRASSLSGFLPSQE